MFRTPKDRIGAAALTLALAGCMGQGDAPQASRTALAPGDPALVAPELTARGEVVSTLIPALQARRSVLAPGSAYRIVADAVLQASAASAESALRVKRLTAEARSKNWLPKIGPDVSLTSLSSIVAGLVLDQALFDNGRRRAERDLAAADVEVAAVTLATELNNRVYEGLSLYIEAERAADLAAITRTALARMDEFERIVRVRFEGGLSDKSEYRLISQKRAEMQATLASAEEGRLTALAELSALAGGPVAAASGLSALPDDAGTPEALAMLKARGEAARTLAELRLARSGLRPGLGAEAGLGLDGGLSTTVAVDGEAFGFGHRAKLQALAEGEEVARRQVEETGRDSARKILSLQRDIASLTVEQAQGAAVLAATETNLDLFTEQYKAGGRTLIELVGQFESLVKMRRDQASLRYEIARARLQIAALRGVLVDGASM